MKRRIRRFLRDKSKKGHNKQLWVSLGVAFLATIAFAYFPDLWDDPESNEKFRSAVPGVFSSFFGSILTLLFTRKGDKFIQAYLKKIECITIFGLFGLVGIMVYATTYATSDEWHLWSLSLSLVFSTFISLYIAICDIIMKEEESDEADDQNTSVYLVTCESIVEKDEPDSAKEKRVNTYLVTCEKIIVEEESDGVEEQQK